MKILAILALLSVVPMTSISANSQDGLEYAQQFRTLEENSEKI